MLFAYYALLPVVAGLVAFDCNSKSVNLTTISLVSTPSCDPSTANITTTDVKIAVTQSTEKYELEFFRCHMESRNHMGRCGRSIDTFHHAGLFSSISHPSRESCLRMHTQGLLSIVANTEMIDITVKPNEQTRFSYVSRGFVDSSGSCTPGPTLVREGRVYERPLVNTELVIILSKGTAMVLVEENQIRFPNGKTCRLSDDTCFDADYGEVFWTTLKPLCDGPESEKSLVYEGRATLVTDHTGNKTVQYVQVNYGGYDFQVLLEEKHEMICGYRSLHTEHPSLFVTFLSTTGPTFPLKRKMTSVDVSLLNFVNSKLVYSFRHVKQEVSRLFDLFNMDRCHAHNRITQNMMSLALLPPQEFAYMYGGPRYSAVTRGEVVYLAKCRPVPVVPDLEEEGCFNELPVKYNNVTMYLTPRSRILISVGTPLPCLPDLLPKYFLNDNWYVRTSHGLITVPSPNVITPDVLSYEFRELSGITGLYRADMIRQYQNALISPMVESVITSRVVGSLSGGNSLPSGYKYTSGFTPLDYDAIKEKVGSFWDRFTDSAVRAGGWFGFIFIMFGMYKFCLYVASVVINFMHVRHDVGALWAIRICLFDVLCNLVFHGRIWKGKRAGQVEDIEIGLNCMPDD